MGYQGAVCLILSSMMTLSAHCHEALADTGSNSNSLKLYTEIFPPYNFKKNSELRGINYEIVATACKRARIQCDIELAHWNRAYSNALNNINTGVFTTARYPKREHLFKWAGPLVYSNACFYRLQERADIVVKNSEDLSNYTVGIPRGDIYQDVLHDLGLTEGNEYITFSNKHEDTFMFAQQKLDLMIGSSLTLSFQLEQVGLKPDDVIPVLELNDDALGGNYLAINNNTSPETIKALQVAFDSMLADGSYGHIIAHYVQKPDISRLSEGALIRCLNGSTNITPANK